MSTTKTTAPALPALYVLAQEYREAADTLADLDMPPEVVADTLESLAGDLEQKSVNLAMLARSLEATAAQMKEAEGQMKQRREAIERRAEQLRAYLLGAMQHAGIRKVSSPWFNLAVRTSPPAVDVQDAAQIPAEFMRTPAPPPPAPDKIAIREALKAGRDVPGCRLVTGERLHIGV